MSAPTHISNKKIALLLAVMLGSPVGTQEIYSRVRESPVMEQQRDIKAKLEAISSRQDKLEQEISHQLRSNAEQLKGQQEVLEKIKDAVIQLRLLHRTQMVR